MREALTQAGYYYDESTQVFSRRGYEPIAYSEGDMAEDKLAAVISSATDVSLFSRQLRVACDDWSTTYHLHPARANILRPFSGFLTGNVLEIGAGCGAVTRFLGECGGKVMALEGSRRRADIAAMRTRDLDNVCVVAEDFNQLGTVGVFNVVTLIGVLEYAGLYTHTETPELSLLMKAKSLLAPGGILILAIENQLGLKYFAGAPEDHLGIPLYGLENHYAVGQPRTFGRAQLSALLRQASFMNVDYFSPAPDYKLASTILSTAGIRENRLNAATLLGQSAGEDGVHLNFAMDRVWDPVCRNELAMELANSFLVVASVDGKPAIPDNVLAWHYSTMRQLEFCKQMQFIRDPFGDIRVLSQPIDRTVVNPIQESQVLNFVLPSDSPYVAGEPLSDEFWRIVSRPGWNIETLGKFIKKYLNILRRIIHEEGVTSPNSSLPITIPGVYLDAVPQNIILDDAGRPHFIDREWQVQDEIELEYLVFRALLIPANMGRNFASPADPRHVFVFNYILDTAAAAGSPITAETFQRFVEREKNLQRQVAADLFDRIKNHWDDEWLLPGLLYPIDKNKYTALYYCERGETFAARNLLRQKFDASVDEMQVYRFVLPPDAKNVDCIRFDPIDYPGIVLVQSLRLFAPDGSCAWSWDLSEKSIVASNGLNLLLADGDTAVVWAWNDDPQIVFEVDKMIVEAVGTGWFFEVRMKPAEISILSRLLNERQTKLADFANTLAGQNADLTAIRAELAAVYHSRKWRWANKIANFVRFLRMS